jgi:hypothetical protein
MTLPGRKMPSLDIGQEGHRSFTLELYLHSQSDMGKYIIKNNAIANSSPPKFIIGQTPAPAIL